MSNFIKFLICIIVLIFVALAFNALISGGSWQEITSYFVASASVALMGGIGWFFQRFPPAPIAPDEDNSAWAQLNSYRKRYPEWQGKLVYYGVPALIAIVLLLRLHTLLASM